MVETGQAQALPSLALQAESGVHMAGNDMVSGMGTGDVLQCDIAEEVRFVHHLYFQGWRWVACLDVMVAAYQH